MPLSPSSELRLHEEIQTLTREVALLADTHNDIEEQCERRREAVEEECQHQRDAANECRHELASAAAADNREVAILQRALAESEAQADELYGARLREIQTEYQE